MKRVVSVSLGSSKRNHSVCTEILGEEYKVERIGTDGNMEEAIRIISRLDGAVEAFGMGGIDLYIRAGKRRFVLREARKMAAAARQTPIVDGSGLKDTLERNTVEFLMQKGYELAGKRVLLVCAMDRFGMAEAFESAGCQMTYGDFIFALGIPVPLHSLRTLYRAACIVAPVASQLPFKMLYPTGKEQEVFKDKFSKYYYNADIIAGDFHYIKRFLPSELGGKIIITNTITTHDIQMLKERGAAELISTTPEFNGRSFGTNVMEALLVAAAGAEGELKPDEYSHLLSELKFTPRIEILN